MPREPHRVLAPERRSRSLNLIGDSGMRLFVCGIGGLVAVLLLAEVVRAVVLLALPLLVVLALVYWARERRRRYY
ncbi:MAG TPA: hypothetical protein VHB98_04035 [Chloroflexota bacterium]|nr:hypothetical protein [Chloroflexota bacterium]